MPNAFDGITEGSTTRVQGNSGNKPGEVADGGNIIIGLDYTITDQGSVTFQSIVLYGQLGFTSNETLKYSLEISDDNQTWRKIVSAEESYNAPRLSTGKVEWNFPNPITTKYIRYVVVESSKGTGDVRLMQWEVIGTSGEEVIDYDYDFDYQPESGPESGFPQVEMVNLALGATTNGSRDVPKIFRISSWNSANPMTNAFDGITFGDTPRVQGNSGNKPGEVASGGNIIIGLDYTDTAAGSVTFQSLVLHGQIGFTSNDTLEYTIETSNDNKTWTKIVTAKESQQARRLSTGRVVWNFPEPITAKYIRYVVVKSTKGTGDVRLMQWEIFPAQSFEYEEVARPAPDGTPYADYFLNHPGSGFAMITPVYSGMSLTIGQPALVDVTRTTDKFPAFNITNAKRDVIISGKLYGPSGTQVASIQQTSVPDGNTILKFPDSVTLARGTYRAVFELAVDITVFYDTFYFTAIDDFQRYRSTPNVNNSGNANVANTSPDSRSNVFPAIQLGADGKLQYFPDYKGNRIMDYSRVGYGGGEIPIPTVQTVVTLQPLSNPQNDARSMIQNAIDQVSARPLVNGFRGAIYLSEGVYRISGPLYVRSSGVVLRGAGEGKPSQIVRNGNTINVQRANESVEPGVTKLIATWVVDPTFAGLSGHISEESSPWTTGEANTLINFIGDAPTLGAAVLIHDQYVGAGQNSVHVSSVAGFRVGELVHVRKSNNESWVRAMYMDRVDGNSNWLSRPVELDASEHVIAAIDYANNILTFEDPLPDNLDMRWGLSRVIKLTSDNRLSNVGVEKIQGITHFSDETKPSVSSFGTTYNAYNDENHAGRFVGMNNVKNGWVRNFISYHFDRTVETRGRSRNITVQDGYSLDPVSQQRQGERRYAFHIAGSSSHIFMQRLTARHARHAFAFAAGLPGPNVFLDTTESYPSSTSEPHLRWSTGGLYDNVTSRIAIQNQWSWGTSQGISGVNYVVYNCTGAFTVSQPLVTPNYVIGHKFDPATNLLGTGIDANGRVAFRQASVNMGAAGLNGGMVPNFPAYEYSIGSHVTPERNNMPRSLYIQQLNNRLGSQGDPVPDGDDVTVVDPDIPLIEKPPVIFDDSPEPNEFPLLAVLLTTGFVLIIIVGALIWIKRKRRF